MSSVFVCISNLDGIDRPVGVVSTHEKAEAFYQADTTNRDYIAFNIDEIVGVDAINPGVEVENPPLTSLRAPIKHLENTRNRLDQLTNKLRDKSFKSKMLQNK